MPWNNATISFNRDGWLLMRYLLSPFRYSRRVIATSVQSIANTFCVLSKTRVTSQKFAPFLKSVPPKMTSCILPPRRFFADCSPKTHRTASATLLLPQPFGPTIQVTPSSKRITVLSANDLKPTSCISFKFKVVLLTL